eukprot:686828-Pelagomonas_calceolata.AAC.1
MGIKRATICLHRVRAHAELVDRAVAPSPAQWRRAHHALPFGAYSLAWQHVLSLAHGPPPLPAAPAPAAGCYRLIAPAPPA